MPQENEQQNVTQNATQNGTEAIQNTSQNTPQNLGASISYRQLFDEALALQQQKNWDASLGVYLKILDQNKAELNVFQAAAIYHNMSSIAYQKGDLLKAYVWSKKSLTLQPSNSMAEESFLFYSKKFQPPSVAHHISNLDNLKMITAKTPLDVWIILSLILVFVSFWLMLKNMITSKKNQLANDFKPLPKAPIYIMLIITSLVISISYIRYLEASTSRGIVIAEKAQVQTTPGENKSIIYEAEAGLELELLKFEKGYYQIRYPGAFSGWVKDSQIEALSLDFKHEK